MPAYKAKKIVQFDSLVEKYQRGIEIYGENDLQIVLNYCDGNYDNHLTHFMVSLGLQIMGTKHS